MGSITRQTWREKHYQIPANKSFEIDFVDSQPNYVVIYNKSTQQLYVSRYPGASATSYDFTVPPLSNRQWGWDGPLNNLYVFQGGPGMSDINLTSYAAMFDPAAVSQSGQNVVIANDINVASMPAVQIANATIPVTGNVSITGVASVNVSNASIPISGNVGINGTTTVNIANTPTVNVGGNVTVGNTSLPVTNTSGGTLNVAGTVNIGNTPSVNIANTVNANITAGAVNATIQNASIDTQVINAELPVKPVADRMYSFVSKYTGDLVYAGAGGGLLKQLTFVIQNQENIAKAVGITNGGVGIINLVMPSSPSGSASSIPYTLTFGNGIVNNGIQVSVSGTAGMCFVSGYGLTDN